MSDECNPLSPGILFNELLVERRIASGYPQIRLAGLLMVHPCTLMHWNNGVNIPRRSTLERIMPNLVSFLGLDADAWMASWSNAKKAGYWRKGQPRHSHCRRGLHLLPDTPYGRGGGRGCKEWECRHEKQAEILARRLASNLVNGILCRVSDCENPVRYAAQRLCNAHYQKLRIYGDPLADNRPRSSEFRGVIRRADGSGIAPWRATILVNGKRYSGGQFLTPEDAARSYDRMARELLGDKARLNFPEDGTE